VSQFRRRNRIEPYYVAECTATPDQGIVEAWISRRGRTLFICDVCHATWYDPRDLDPATLVDITESDAPERPAARAELEALGWWAFVHPLSLAAHGEAPDRPAQLAPGTWGPPHPAPYWIAGCAANDQGRVVAWTTWNSRLVLFCDVCFRDPETAEALPESGTWADGDRLRRAATREELEQAGWWDLVDRRSLQARGETS
jgi:hypothetical protein